MPRILLLLFCLSWPLAAQITRLPLRAAQSDDWRTLDYPVAFEPLALTGWLAIAGDDPAYAAADGDDTGWRPVQVGRPLDGQGVAANGWCWYRVDFTLPEAWQNHLLKLDLGRVSAYDEIYLNGSRCGSYGTPPPNLVHGCSNVYRQYLLPSDLLRPGRNRLAVRVFLGIHSGLYDGAYTLQPLPQNAVCMQLPLKNGGGDSMKLLLSDASHLNRVQAGAEMLCVPELLTPGSATLQAELAMTMTDAAGTIVFAANSGTLPLPPGQWQPLRIQGPAPAIPGSYQVALAVRGRDIPPLQKSFSVTVTDAAEKLAFSLPVWNTLAADPLPVAITPGPMGRFGPREATSDGQLADNLDGVDSRSGQAYSVRTRSDVNGPLLFLANVRPVPAATNLVGRFHRAAGHVYDGIQDAWLFGRVCPNRTGKPELLQVKDISWTGRTYHYRYPDGDSMNFTVNLLSPAWMAETGNPKLRVFDDILRHGIGLPAYLACDTANGIQIVPASKGINGDAMTANWILAWFNGADGWDEFDVPYLFVLENRPQRVRTYADAALFFEFARKTGRLQGMPLYGVTLPPPEQTAGWAAGLPPEVAERCRYWARVLAAPPATLQRTAAIDYAGNRLTVRDEITFTPWQDAWNTAGLPVTPLSTMLPLAAASGNLAIGTDRPVRDLQMATLQGPLLAAENSHALTFAVDGLLHLVREVRHVTPADSPEIQAVRTELNQLLAEGCRTELNLQPWPVMFAQGRFMPGAMRCDFTNLLLSRVWMEPELRRQIDHAIQTACEKYLLHDAIPDPEMQARLAPDYHHKPVVSVITQPVTGLSLAVPTSARESFGIDAVYFANLTVYVAWLYADTYNRYDWLKTHRQLLVRFFNTARNSHDWATLASWDTFGGLRVGNGLQESGGIHAGAVAMARIARQLGDDVTADLAAYHAVMQLVSMQGALAASGYLNACRPWPASHSRAREIERVQKLRPFYYAEINELAGLSQALIGADATASSPGGFIESPLPEVMRPYQEIWGDYTDDFYAPHYDRLLRLDRRLDSRTSVDAFVYQTRRSSAEIRDIFNLRRQRDDSWWRKLPDYRGYLDSMSTATSRRLW